MAPLTPLTPLRPLRPLTPLRPLAPLAPRLLRQLLLPLLLLLLLLSSPLCVHGSSIAEDIADMQNAGVDLNKPNEQGVTMLIAAARNGNVEVVQALTRLSL